MLAQPYLNAACKDEVAGRLLALPWWFAAVLLFRSARAKSTGPRRFLGRGIAVAYVTTGAVWLAGPEVVGPVRARLGEWAWLAAACAVGACSGFVYATSPARR